MSYKRLFAILTLVAMLFSLTSCGRIVIEDVYASYGAVPTPAETYEEDEMNGDFPYAEYEKYHGNVGKRQTAKYLDEIGTEDLGGATVIIASAGEDYISADNVGTELSRFAAMRNAAVEDSLNVRLVSVSVSENTLVKQLKQSTLAGKERYDVLTLELSEIGRFAYDGLIIDMLEDAKIDADKPYFNISSISAASFGGVSYGIAGYGSIMPTSYPAIFMNTEMLWDAGIDPHKLYTAAERGEWTWDEFLKYTDIIGAIGEYNTVSSQSMADSLADAAFISSGNRYLYFDCDGIATVGYDPDSAANAVGYISALMNNPRSIISSERNSIGNFAAGKTAFAIEYLYVMSWLVNSSANWGILPLPKSDEKADYRSLVADDALLFAIPSTSHDKEAAAFTVAAINAASEGYVYEPFVSYNMNNVLRDNESVNMLDIILNSAVFDRAVTYDERFPSLAAITELVRGSALDDEWAKTYEDMAKEANDILKDELPIYFVEDEPPETEPLETEAPETEIPETDAPETDAPETKPAETKPAETKPAETKPAETKPAETKPAETTPAETTPVETKPAETTPTETIPSETTPAEILPPESEPAETKPE